ncbi:hypothetical protein [Marinobacter maritimus]|uniref:hypothetical protein n=1 Tax=Marinobacter maritimus TaxID=277961 RepID=UPI0011A299E5|nr:hypothetical protein [Marinobacter maritimus]
MREELQDIENIKIFALSVAEVMDSLYERFPIPCSLPSSELINSYGPTDADVKPRKVEVADGDYLDLLPYGFDEYASIENASGESFDERRCAEKGYPFLFWTKEQRKAIKSKHLRQRHVKRIREHSIRFLLREGFITDVEANDPGKHKNFSKLVITSKGFAQMNKQFEGGVIREKFHFRYAKELATTVKEVGGVARAGDTLVRVLSAFFM